ncbi:ASCH domain-containing protein [Achromobacter mucicolens]|uniref:ASCH domain-containing protein n=1 Tax=Achromobacter mucicolens TaxID=1389922 RepID=UPI0007C84468|nr:ASCH domain-containing protein [Achromobacter mucicolens]OAE55103.1 hypothetical protein A7J67_11375 [Achromobacter xylosoxidans]PTX00547.1 ASCH domain-containing protein [Achromobacter mucicolens]
MKRQLLQFSEPLKQAILDGAKVQSRRILKPQPSKLTTVWYADASDSGRWVAMGPSPDNPSEMRKTSSWVRCPYGKSGETIILADEAGAPFASAVVVGVRIQRLQNLTEADARAEGTQTLYQSSALLPGVPLQTAFALMWCERYGAHAWAANPWVWVVEYRQTTPFDKSDY